MKLIKLAIISIVLLFLLVTAVSLLFPSHVRISRAPDINASKDSAMENQLGLNLPMAKSLK
jgi:hypothetical protein